MRNLQLQLTWIRSSYYFLFREDIEYWMQFMWLKDVKQVFHRQRHGSYLCRWWSMKILQKLDSVYEVEKAYQLDTELTSFCNTIGNPRTLLSSSLLDFILDLTRLPTSRWTTRLRDICFSARLSFIALRGTWLSVPLPETTMLHLYLPHLGKHSEETRLSLISITDIRYQRGWKLWRRCSQYYSIVLFSLLWVLQYSASCYCC